MLVGLTISIIATLRLIYVYVEPHIWRDRRDRWVLLVCFVAYIVAWVPVWLFPFDMVGLEARRDARERCSEQGISWLSFVWKVIYVLNLAAGYLTYDFARSYLDAGGFSIQRNLALAWVDVRDWYGKAAVVCAVLIAGLAFQTHQAFNASLCAPHRAHRNGPV